MSATREPSPDRVRANQANSQKSTGPRTPEGKDRSRLNAVKHGLAGAGVALPPDDQAAFDTSLEAWSNLFSPKGPTEESLVRILALAALRMERAAFLDLVGQAADRLDALATWDQARRLHAEALGRKLSASPAHTVLSLQITSEGCEWLLTRWQTLQAALQVDTPNSAPGWTEAHLSLAFDLLGIAPEDREFHPRARRWRNLFNQTITQPETEPDTEPDTCAPAARQKLAQLVKRQINHLKSRSADLWDNVESHHHADLVASRVLLTTPRFRLHHRYESAAFHTFNRAWNLLLHLQKRRDSGIRESTPQPRALSTPPPNLKPSTLEATLEAELDSLLQKLNARDTTPPPPPPKPTAVRLELDPPTPDFTYLPISVTPARNEAKLQNGQNRSVLSCSRPTAKPPSAR